MRAAKVVSVDFDAMADDVAVAVPAAWCQSLNGTLKAVEDEGLSVCRDHLECLVVLVSAGGALTNQCFPAFWLS